MFFIFGWGHTVVNDYGPVQEEECPNCHNKDIWHLKKISRWFTLFFIPVFPHDSEHIYHCPICNFGRKLSKEDFTDYKTIAELNKACLEKKITEDERLTKVKAVFEAKQMRDDTENAKNAGDSTKWADMVAEKTVEELETILSKKTDEYNPAYIIAAKAELERRKK